MPGETQLTAREWMRILIPYRTPKFSRSLFEFFVTFIPFLALWTGAYFALSISYFLTLGLSALSAVFLVRLFIIQHDCGHGSYFQTKNLNNWMGRFIGLFTMAPYDVWRRAHNTHHANSGNLDNRGIGDIYTLTVTEYQALSKFKKFMYRAYRHPFALFVIGPIFVFIFHYRLPIGFMNAGKRYWVSSMGTNLAIIILAGLLIYFIGFIPFLMVYFPIQIIGAAIGVWMFYVQHQFEDTYWDKAENWTLEDAALFGSSHYDLPAPLRWLTGNIGIHHVHHLNSRIPFYRLTEVLRNHPALTGLNRITFWQSIKCVKLQLWDENKRCLISFTEANRAYA
ncbi:MAG: fatty acid desaturase [Robiginitomaculum sp.]